MADASSPGLVPPDPNRFPVDGIVGQVSEALTYCGAVVVIAPPGTGKTTRLPLLLAALGGSDRLIVTEPRRVATRAAAGRDAGEGSKSGVPPEEIGAIFG